MAGYTPPPLTPPGPPNDTNPDSGLLGKGGAGGSLPPDIVDNQPLLQQALQDNEINLIAAQDPYMTPIEGVLGGLPVAEKNQEYFAVVFEAMDTSPEIIDQTQFKVTYLCDSILNVSKPAQDTVARNNIIQNFERQRIATVRVDQGTVLNQQLAGNHKITAVGSLEPIIGTQLGKGPLEYSTTMSFVLNDQLGSSPGVPVVDYYIISQKQGGYQDLPFAHTSSGYIDNIGPGGIPIGNWSYSNVADANYSTPVRVHYDGLNSVATGSGSFMTTSFPTDINPDSAFLNALSFNLDNYFNEIKFTTGSLEGWTRVKATLGASVTIITSSINDLYMSTLSSIDEPLFALATLKVFKSGSGGIIELGYQQKPINAFNQSLVGGNNQDTYYNMQQLTLGDFSNINNILDVNDNNFSWGPIMGVNNDGNLLYSSQDIIVETDYFDFEEGDRIYGEIFVNNETIASPSFLWEDNNQYNIGLVQAEFTASLANRKNDATKRKYLYKWGSLKINQEVPVNTKSFVQGITGVTASYGFVGGNNEVTQSFYNYTSSYWVGFNNTTSSLTESISYITASSVLTNFYGGNYIQINPGLESYNLYNANGQVQTPLYPDDITTNDKITWDSFGFNPINSPFIPIIGDFIRFEYSKSKLFQIIGVNSLGGNLKLKLNGHIPISTILDNFVIYRIVEDGQYIILDVKKNNEAGVNQAFSGIITAQYRSEGLEERADALIYDLKQAGIIDEGAYLSRRGYTQ